MKLGANLHVAKQYIQNTGKKILTATKKFKGRAVAKLSSIEVKNNIKKGFKVIGKKITARKTIIIIKIKKSTDQETTKVTIKGNKNINLEGLTDFLERRSSESTKKPLLQDKPTVPPKPAKKTTTNANLSKDHQPSASNATSDIPKVPSVPPISTIKTTDTDLTTKVHKKNKPAVPPKPAKKTTTNANLPKDHQPSASNATSDIPKVPPVPPINTMKTTDTASTVEKNTTKKVSRDNLFQEIRDFNPKKNLNKTDNSHQAKNTKSDLQLSLEAVINKRRKSIDPDD